MLGFIQGVLFVAAAVTLREAIFGPTALGGEVAVVAAVTGATAGVVADIAVAVHLPFEWVIVAALVGQVSMAAWYLLAATSLVRAGGQRRLGWLGLAGSVAYLASASALAFQFLADDYAGDLVLWLYLLLVFAVAFLAWLGWLAISDAQLRLRTAA